MASTMRIGVDYYPEHWPRESWETSADQMKAAGFNVVRLAEFAWVLLEPEEGRYDFAWLDDAIRVLSARGISVILGTPTAVMPAWMARKYPECMATKATGERIRWGVRRHNCFTAAAYRLLSERITRAMADHYAKNPAVIGWQTDNELGQNLCTCANCLASFHDWLRARYKTLPALNDAWGTRFWGHIYHEWAEIPVPEDAGSHNPSLLLDWQRYGSWLNVRFQDDQLRILRATCPTQFVTHNFMGYHADLDYYDLAKDLDFVAWDNYPVWHNFDIHYDAAGAADVMRGLKGKNFWIMEQTAGPGGWGDFGRNTRPGELRKIAFQQVAHGADAMIWFRWRTCTVGREQYWHGLLGHDGIPARRYREAAQTATELHTLWSELEGTTVEAEAAMIYDYESIWATRIQKSFASNDWLDQVKRLQNACVRAGIAIDMVRPGADVSKYKMVIAPQLYLLPDALARQLDAFVRNGGVLVTGLRTGVKDEFSRCHARTLPGLLTEALGIRIEEYESIGSASSYTFTGQGPCAGAYTGTGYADWIQPTTAESLGSYQAWHMTAYAAATRNRCGRGWGFYVGTNVAEPAFYDRFIAAAASAAGVVPALAPPPGVEAMVRSGGGRRLLFLLNHTEAAVELGAPSGATALLGAVGGGRVQLPPCGVAVLKLTA